MLEYDVIRQNPHQKPKHVLLVFHGLGADKDNLKFLYQCWPKDQGLEAWFFQAPLRWEVFFGQEWIPSWFPIPSLEEPHPEAKGLRYEVLQECAQLLAPAISAGAEVHVAGFSQGGVMALAATEIFSVSSAALFSTFWPEQGLPKIQGSPRFFLSHGDADEIVPIESGLFLHRSLELFQPELCWVSGMGHAINDESAASYQAFIQQVLLKS